MTETLRTIIVNANEIVPVLSMMYVKENTEIEHIAQKFGFTYALEVRIWKALQKTNNQME